MTKQELNRDVKRLCKKVIWLSDEQPESYFIIVENEIKPEFDRLYYADRDFEYMNKSSVLAMIRINLKLRFVSLHNFGLFIDLDKIY